MTGGMPVRRLVLGIWYWGSGTGDLGLGIWYWGGSGTGDLGLGTRSGKAVQAIDGVVWGRQTERICTARPLSSVDADRAATKPPTQPASHHGLGNAKPDSVFER